MSIQSSEKANTSPIDRSVLNECRGKVKQAAALFAQKAQTGSIPFASAGSRPHRPLLNRAHPSAYGDEIPNESNTTGEQIPFQQQAKFQQPMKPPAVCEICGEQNATEIRCDQLSIYLCQQCIESQAQEFQPQERTEIGQKMQGSDEEIDTENTQIEEPEEIQLSNYELPAQYEYFQYKSFNKENELSEEIGCLQNKDHKMQYPAIAEPSNYEDPTDGDKSLSDEANVCNVLKSHYFSFFSP